MDNQFYNFKISKMENEKAGANATNQPTNQPTKPKKTLPELAEKLGRKAEKKNYTSLVVLANREKSKAVFQFIGDPNELAAAIIQGVKQNPKLAAMFTASGFIAGLAGRK